jgi:hypothetical protein
VTDGAAIPQRPAAMDERRFLAWACAIVAVAWLLREWFVLAAVFPAPEQGDAAAYVRYALHLLIDNTFSQVGDIRNPPPDAFRGPGYPFFLALIHRVVGWDAWYGAVKHVQALVGAATVAGVIALGRRWLPLRWALVAGALLAVQPHHIAATGAMLVEVVFGFLVVAGLLAALVAIEKRSLPLAALAGACLGAGYLVNPVLLLFAPLLFVAFWRERWATGGAAMLVVVLVAAGGWWLRNASHGITGGDRAAINVVQGSWPDYHRAWRQHLADPAAAQVLRDIDAETRRVAAGDSAPVWHRLGADPGRYALWYLVEKPYLLWDWDIRMGAGGINTLDVVHSPLERGAPGALVALQRWLNPLVFVLALVGLGVSLRTRGAAVAWFVAYITAVHVVFQAEPRYAIAYRAEWLLLATAGMAWIEGAWRARRVDAGATVEPVELAQPRT